MRQCSENSPATIRDVNGFTYTGTVVSSDQLEIVIEVSACVDENGLPVAASRYRQPMHIRRDCITKMRR